ncbi:MAG: Ni/Fe-hydrogenase, b-type cytochrome subunit [Bradyrhizobium sp.]|uniref:Ni/Fe-hydrogenase, b-type cytochrome subunit n=1 Tax=Bradyrhizobium sp. TaxID=376 RepID=UPI0025BB7185|nr:Ni/Fe-hydrogenase, b-type cytochrome subunit [Bradyrhizobium sp.]MBI5260242.1 Ni/Fe-hydrogenase, b-type cytochrome subunit [Bradyrhizobium sp.]
MTYCEIPDDGTIPPPIVTHDAPSRICHWASVICVLALIVSGYFIGEPLPSVGGDTSELYTMGDIRFVHLAAGQLFSAFFLFRVYWAFRKKGYARQMFLPDFWTKSWSDGIVAQVKWNLMLLPRSPRYVGINPLAATTGLLLYVLPAVLTILTGFAMLAEVAGHDSWQYRLFGWMMIIFPNTLDLHLVHRVCMWIIVFFVCLHIYIAIRDDILSRQTLISSMLSGERLFRR